MFQPNEVVHYKEIVAMDVLAKLFNSMTLASAAQEISGSQSCMIRENCRQS